MLTFSDMLLTRFMSTASENWNDFVETSSYSNLDNEIFAHMFAKCYAMDG